MDNNEKELDRQHERWLEPPDDTEEVVEPARAKLILTFELDYELKPEYYPDGLTPMEMLEIDIDSYKEDFMLLVDHPSTTMTFKGELK